MRCKRKIQIVLKIPSAVIQIKTFEEKDALQTEKQSALHASEKMI